MLAAASSCTARAVPTRLPGGEGERESDQVREAGALLVLLLCLPQRWLVLKKKKSLLFP